jgi:hypothetical protein
MQLASGSGTFLGAAQQGMFAIDLDAASRMLTSIKQIRTSLDEQRMRIRDLEEQVMLGDLMEAQAIAELDTQVASGGSHSLNDVLRRFGEELDHLHQAVEACIRNYQQDDAQAAQGFRRIGEI